MSKLGQTVKVRGGGGGAVPVDTRKNTYCTNYAWPITFAGPGIENWLIDVSATTADTSTPWLLLGVSIDGVWMFVAEFGDSTHTRSAAGFLDLDTSALTAGTHDVAVVLHNMDDDSEVAYNFATLRVWHYPAASVTYGTETCGT